MTEWVTIWVEPHKFHANERPVEGCPICDRGKAYRIWWRFWHRAEPLR